MIIREAISNAVRLLKKNNIEEPFLKAKILLASILNESKEYLLINENRGLSKNEELEYEGKIQRLIDGEPLQHLTNKQEFMKQSFFVNDKVLIPRPDTEILVEEVIKLCENFNEPQILDLCTGSGAIAISLAKYLKYGKVFASDISREALEVAEINKSKLINKQINFIESNLFENIGEIFDIIVSNPPYIETDNIKKLSKEVQNEPLIALDGGEDGLNFYRKIIGEAYKYLKEDGYLAMEIGYNQKEAVIKLLEENKEYCNIYSKKDLANNYRIVVCNKKGNN